MPTLIGSKYRQIVRDTACVNIKATINYKVKHLRLDTYDKPDVKICAIT